MDYQQTIDWLYSATPQFQRIGAAAYKPGLTTARMLADAFGNPQNSFPTIHVAGTNGKGSTCHTLAAILQRAGYNVGLYTSPHLVDFRERIKVDGAMISREGVIDFVERWRAMQVDCKPSFFELTTIMAFDWFARQGVDVAVIETGLGGRLDTTNIINPQLCVITNISFDHQAQLGDTLAQIASEKAGIIKAGIPVVIGNGSGEGVREAFERKAREESAPIVFAEDHEYWAVSRVTDRGWIYEGTAYGDIVGELTGDCQQENAATVMESVEQLRQIGYKIPDRAVVEGMASVVELTGLSGRWMTLQQSPRMICDTGHNVGGWKWLAPRLTSLGNRLSMVIGFVNDKDVSHIMELMPREANYYFTQASVPRAMDADQLALIGSGYGLTGRVYPSVEKAVGAALQEVGPDGVVFVGGSTFVVADLLAMGAKA